MAATAETLTSQPGQTSTSHRDSKRDWAPTAKVSVGILAASLSTLLLPLWKKLTGSDLEAAQATAVTTLITFVIQYWVPERKSLPE